MTAESVLRLNSGMEPSAERSRQIHPAPVALSIIIPTFNERENVRTIVDRLDLVLQSIPWEVIFVDDASPDGTANAVRALARVDRRVRLISRHNRRGLASAVVEGGLAASGEVIAVMDGDLQHDENVLPELYRRVASGEADIASASRFLENHAREGLSSDNRLKMSNTGIAMANRFFGLELTDPLTGFFALRREDMERAVPRLSGLGFKILLDLVTSMEPRPRVSEAPFRFRARIAGESKLDNRVKYDFLLFFLEKSVGRFAPIPGSWLSWAIISCLGVLVHMALVVPAVSLAGMPFEASQLLATLGSLFATFTINNTIAQTTLKGNRFWTGFIVFSLFCAIGVAANVGIASLLNRDFDTLVYVVPALCGALVSVVWNFAAGKIFWRWKMAHARNSKPQAKDLPVTTSQPSPTVEERGWPTAPALSKHKHLIKYLLIGATASAIDVALFLIIYNLVGASALVAHSISVPASVLFSFFVNARHNFKTADHMILRLLSFILVCTVGYMSGFGVIELCRQQGLDANVGKIISLPVVFAIQYVLNSRITFYTPRRTDTVA